MIKRLLACTFSLIVMTLTSCNLQIGEIDIRNKKNWGQLREAFTTIYAPTSQENIEAGIKKLENFCTADMLNELRRNINSYKDGARQSVVINNIKYSEETEAILVDLTVNFESEGKGIRTFIELYINGENKIYRYDVINFEK